MNKTAVLCFTKSKLFGYLTVWKHGFKQLIKVHARSKGKVVNYYILGPKIFCIC